MVEAVIGGKKWACWGGLLLLGCSERVYLPVGDFQGASSAVLAYRDQRGVIQGFAFEPGDSVGPIELDVPPGELEARLIFYDRTLLELYLPIGALEPEQAAPPLPLDGAESLLNHLDPDQLYWEPPVAAVQPWPEAHFRRPGAPPRFKLKFYYVGATPAEGIDICLERPEADHCRRTDAGGFVEMDGLEQLSEHNFVAQGVNFAPHLYSLRIPKASPVPELPIVTTTYLSQVVSRLPTTLTATAGQVFFLVIRGVPISGAQVESEPAHRSYYVDDIGYADPARNQTSIQGIGMFLNVPPGILSLRATKPSGCLPEPDAWLGAAPDQLRLEVRASYLSWGHVLQCP